MAPATSLAFPKAAPTRPFPSPTTTNTDQLLLRPPLIVFETGLIWTTLSSNSACASPSCRLLLMPCPPKPYDSKDQTAFTRSFGDGRHPAMVGVASAVENGAFDAFLLHPGGDQLPDGPRRLSIAGGLQLRFQLRIQRGGVRERPALHVIDGLRVGMFRTPVHSQTRPLGRALDLFANPLMPPLARLRTTQSRHASSP